MKFQESNGEYIIRLEKGEELVATLTGFCAEHDIKSGYIVNGVGAVQRATVGYYNLRNKKYVFRQVKDAVELISLSGNVSEVDNKPFLHLHAIVSSKNNKASGGHVHHIIISATAEIVLRKTDIKLVRKDDEQTGLKLLDL